MVVQYMLILQAMWVGAAPLDIQEGKTTERTKETEEIGTAATTVKEERAAKVTVEASRGEVAKDLTITAVVGVLVDGDTIPTAKVAMGRERGRVVGTVPSIETEMTDAMKGRMTAGRKEKRRGRRSERKAGEAQRHRSIEAGVWRPGGT